MSVSGHGYKVNSRLLRLIVYHKVASTEDKIQPGILNYFYFINIKMLHISPIYSPREKYKWLMKKRDHSELSSGEAELFLS